MRGILGVLLLVGMGGTAIAQNQVYVTGDITVRERKGLDPSLILRASEAPRVHVQTPFETQEKFLRLRLLDQQVQMQQLQIEAQQRALATPRPAPVPIPAPAVATVVSNATSPGADTGKDLAGACQSAEVVCQSFMVGVVDTIDTLITAKMLTIPWWQADRGNIDLGHLVVKYMQAHPEAAEFPASAAALLAIRESLVDGK